MSQRMSLNDIDRLSLTVKLSARITMTKNRNSLSEANVPGIF
jgi:hypothetical protein